MTDKMQRQSAFDSIPNIKAGMHRRPFGCLDLLQRNAGNAYLAASQSGLSSGELRIQRELEHKEDEDQGQLQRASAGPSDREDTKEEE